MKKLIAFLILFTSLIQAQGVMLLFGSAGGTAPRDSVPNSYAFTDSTDAVVSTQIISKPLVLAGYDSALVNVVGGDYKIGNIGSITRLATTIHLGDTLFAVDTSSASNSTTTNVAFTIGGVVDTFSVTTVAGGFTPASLNPVLNLVYDDSVSASGSNTVESWTDNGYVFADNDTSTSKVVQTDSSINFSSGGGVFRNGTGLPFDFGTGDISIEVWFYVGASAQPIMQRDDGSDTWYFRTQDADGLKINFNVWDNDNSAEGNITSSGTGIVDKWAHVVAVLDRDLGARLYIDSTINTTEYTAEWTNMAAYTISTAGYTRIYGGRGDISALRFYDYALTPAQVKSLYEYGIANGRK